MGDVVQFIPRPRHDRDTDFPSIPFKRPASADHILGLEKQANDILGQIEGTHANAIWNDKEPA